jgi:tetratricopeptide (TPR) repeat protein
MTVSDPLQTAFEHHRAGELEQAARIYQQLLADDPNNIRALHLFGALMIQARRPTDAIALLRHGTAIAPASPDMHFLLGDALIMAGDFAGAEAAYRQSISLQPLFPQAHNGLGLALVHQQKLEAAIESWRRSIQLKHDYAEAHANLGAALAQVEKPAEAAEVLNRAVQLNPNFAPAHNNLANVLDKLEQTDEAIPHWERALALYPDYFDALVNLGRTVQRRGQHQRAMDLLDHALRLKPSNPDARFLRGLALLVQGKLTEGFADYAWRMKCAELKIDPRNFREPEWDGSVQLDKILLLHAEQGFGDTFQFIRYAPLVRERVGQVVLECQAELAELLRTVSGIDVIAVRNQGLPFFDMHIALLDLPRAMGTTLETIPAFVPYMSANAEKVKAWSELLAADPPGKRVGVVWSGNPAHGNDRYRSMSLRELEPLAEVEGVTLYSLQKGAAAAQLGDSTLHIRPVDHTARLTDFTETAALLENLDLLITVDTSVAHLAGALGRPVWLMLPFAPDWRWLLDRTDSPWYPTMRLFRQTAIGQWQPVVNDIVAALRELA